MNKKTKKTEETSVATTVAATSTTSNPLPPVGGADALPLVGAPTPPIHDNPVATNTRKGTRVYVAEVNLAESAVRELRNSTLFAEVLGSKLGTAQQIANAIDFAARWDAENKRAAIWSEYAQGQSNLSWTFALAMIDRLRGSVQAAAATDPAVGKELPNFMKLLSVRQAVATKAAATRKRIKSGELVVNKPKKKSAASTPVSTPATVASPVQASSPAQAEAALAPAVAQSAPAGTPVPAVANGANGVAH